MGVDSDPEDLFGSGAESDEDPAPAAAPQTADQHESLDDDVEEPAAGTEKLFGSDSDDEEAKAAPAQAARSTQRQSSDEDEDGDRRTGRRRAAPSGPPMDVEAPLLPVPAANSVHLMRTTNIVGIQPRAFDPATHEKEEEIFEDDNGRARVKLASNAMIRWRLRRLPDGREVPESNARFVRWEDGTMQLLLGHEVLDVAQQDVRANNQYLFCLAGLIQGQCPLNSKLALRPSSLDSGLHRRLREAVDKRHVKTNKVASAGGLQNPELEQARREKAEEEKIRSREQLAKKQDRVLSRPYGGVGGYRSKPSRLSDKYLEEDQDWEGDRDAYDYDDGLTADQRARLSMARTRPAMDEQAEAEAGRRLQAAKRGGTRSDDRGGPSKKRRAAASDDEEEDEDDDEEDGDYDDDEPEYESSGGDEDEGDEDAAPAPPARGGKIKPAPPPPDLKGNKPKRRGVVLSDDDE